MFLFLFILLFFAFSGLIMFSLFLICYLWNLILRNTIEAHYYKIYYLSFAFFDWFSKIYFYFCFYKICYYEIHLKQTIRNLLFKFRFLNWILFLFSLSQNLLFAKHTRNTLLQKPQLYKIHFKINKLLTILKIESIQHFPTITKPTIIK